VEARPVSLNLPTKAEEKPRSNGKEDGTSIALFALAIMAFTLIVAGLQMSAEEGSARAQASPAAEAR
jgi:hypothetical protein